MDELFWVLEMIGTVAFAVCGAMVAIDREADIFGVFFLGAANAIGGGILRDSLLGRVPPAIFASAPMLAAALVCPLAVFAAAAAAGPHYWRRRAAVEAITNVADALGLGAFTVSGVRTGLAAGQQQWLFLLFLGLLTGVGGGVLRDVMTGSTPFVLKKRVYALASLAGAGAYLALRPALPEATAGLLAVGLVFAVRALATAFHWDLPRLQRPAAPPKGK